MKNICSIAFICFVLLAVLSGCISEKQPEKAQYTDITVHEAKDMIDRGDVFILDVRTQQEYDEGHIRGAIRIPVQDIPFQELGEKLQEIPGNEKILVYCRTDRRGTIAGEILVNNGFGEVYNMEGGIVEWGKAGYEVVK